MTNRTEATWIGLKLWEKVLVGIVLFLLISVGYFCPLAVTIIGAITDKTNSFVWVLATIFSIFMGIGGIIQYKIDSNKTNAEQ